MAEEALRNGSPVAQAAANAVSPDPITADLLAKHSAGQTLTPSEYGKLGAFKAKLNKFKAVFTGKGSPPGSGAGPAQPPPGPGQPAGMGPLAPGEASAGGLPPVPPDPRVVQRTTESIIKAVDGIARRKIATEARKAGADDRTAARFDSAAGVPVAAKDMMVETSPDVVAALGLDPKNYPIATFMGGLGLWATNLWLCVDELRALRPAQPKPEPPAAAPKTELRAWPSPGPVIVPPGPALPVPARPPGAPPEVTGKA
jgi:hypothetical protein